MSGRTKALQLSRSGKIAVTAMVVGVVVLVATAIGFAIAVQVGALPVSPFSIIALIVAVLGATLAMITGIVCAVNS